MRYHIVNSANRFIEVPDMDTLKVIHNAGFFSCCSIRLMDIMIWFNQHKRLPDIVDSSEQFVHYKLYPGQDLIPLYFKDRPEPIEWTREMQMTTAKEEPQFSDYHKICFEDIKPFIEKYFTPSDVVLQAKDYFKEKYQIGENTCAVFYRGNDKNRETTIASYDAFISKAHEILRDDPDVRFLVSPDETEFLERFTAMVPNSFNITELPHMSKKDSVMFEEMPRRDRAMFGARFYAQVLLMSECEYLITHSGNCGHWTVMYRGNMDNVHQILNNQWT